MPRRPLPRRKDRRRRCAFETLETRRVLATFIVNTTNDIPSGDCSGGGNTCSIRTALSAAEANVEANQIEVATGIYNVSSDGGPLTYFADHELTIIGTGASPSDVVIDTNSATRVLSIGSGTPGTLTTVTIENLTIQEGSSSNGGGVSLFDANATLNSVTLQDNYAFGDGGGLFSTGTNLGPIPALQINNSVFLDNSATGSGGAVYVDRVNVTLDNVTIQSNDAGLADEVPADPEDALGGGLYITGDSATSPTIIRNSGFSDNLSVGAGAGAAIVGVGADISDTDFIANRILGDTTGITDGGGGLALHGISSVTVATLDNVVVQQNEAPAAGGIGIVNSHVTITGGRVDQNLADRDAEGGLAIGIVATSSLPTSESANLTLQGTSIGNNGFILPPDTSSIAAITAPHPYAIKAVDADISITDTNVSNNDGGGVGSYSDVRTDQVLTIVRSTINSNRPSDSISTWGVQIDDGTFLFENATISDNGGAGFSGGIDVSPFGGSASGRIISSTINENLDNSGNSIAITGYGGSIEVESTIINDSCFYNGSLISAGNNIDAKMSCGLVEPTDIFDVADVDPLLDSLADNGGPVLTHALLSGSPAIDAGSVNSPPTDARGISRPQDGDGDTIIASDIGAYEVGLPPQPTLTIEDVTAVETDGTATIIVTLNLDTEGFSVDVSTTDDTADSPEDYTAKTATLDFDGTAGESQSFTVSIENDGQPEDDENVLLQMSNVQGSFDGGPPDISDTAILTITDPPRLTIADFTVDESDSTATVNVVLDKAVIGGFTVLASTLNGTATDPDDYTHIPELLTFTGTPGEIQSFTVTIVNDSTVEPTESLQLTVADPSNPIVDTSDTAVLTITDSDAAELTIEDVSVDENGTATISVFLDHPVQGGVTVEVTTADDTATNPDDYTSTTDSLVFPSNSVEPQTFSVQIESDSTVETDESILISMQTVSNSLVDITDTAIMTILDDDLATLTIDDVIVDEDTGMATIDVTVDNPVQGGFSVDAFTSDDSASSPDDYTPASPTLTFDGTAGETESFSVPINLDDTLEPNEFVNLFLSGEPALAIDLSDTAILTIRNDDSATLTIADVMANESNLEARLFVSLDNPVQGSFTVDVTTVDGSAVGDEDYTPLTQTLSFAGSAGETSEVVVTLIDDPVVEFDEFFTLGLLNVTNTAVGLGAAATATIRSQDLATLTIDDVSVDESSGSAMIVVRLDSPVQAGVSVNASTSDGTASEPDDYTATSANLGFSGFADETEMFTIPIQTDGVVETDETVLISLFGEPNPQVDISDIGTLRILDDDSATLTIEDVAVDEDTGTATIQVMLDNPVQGGFSVSASTSDDSATSPEDYTSASVPLAFVGTAGEVQSFTVSINPNNVLEPDEAVSVSLSGEPSISLDLSDTATLTIRNDDSATLTIADVIVDESDLEARLIVSLDNPVQGSFTVDVSTADGSAVGDEDYTQLTQTLNFTGSAGETSEVVVTLIDDPVVEFDEFFTLGLTNVSNTSIGLGAAATATVRSEDMATLTIDDVSVDEDTGTATIQVMLDSPVRGGFSVNASTTDDSANSPEDYTPASVPLSFLGTAGEVQSFTVSVNPDNVLEPDETVSVSLSGEPSVSLDLSDTATLTIRNDDVAALTVDDVSVNESAGTATVSVRLDNPVQNGFSVNASTSDGTASEPGDYADTTTTLGFLGNAGETQSFTVPIQPDPVVETDETVFVSLSSELGSLFDISDTGTLTILDDDSAALTMQDVAVDEDDGTVTFQVTLDNPVQGGFTVAVMTSDATASSPDDYMSVNTSLSFDGTSGETKSFTISIEPDDTLEPDEIVLLSLSGETSAALDLSDTATLTIRNDDTAALTVDDVTVDEESEFATVAVRLTGAVQGAFSVDLSIIGGSATLGSDYEASNAQLDFSGAAGETRSIDVSIINDDDPESDETILFGLSNASNPQVDTQDGATLTILDTDVATVANIRGHVYCDADGDGNEDFGETSIGAAVFLDRDGNRRLDDDEEQTVTDENGDYSFNDIPPGGVVLAVPVPDGCIAVPRNPAVFRTLIDVGDLARSIAAADVDHDGDNDLLIAVDASSSLVILGNQGGEFRVDRTIPLSNRPHSVSTWMPAGADPVPAIGVASIGNTGSGGMLFVGSIDGLSPIPSGDGPVDVVVDDLNNDGLADYLTASFRSSDLHLHLAGSASSTVIATGRLVRAATTGDVNADGFDDIAFVAAGFDSDTTSQVGVLYGDGTGTFSDPIVTTSVRDLVSVRIVDLNSGGPNEILVLAQTGNLVALSAATGSISEIERTPVQPGASAFDIGDFDRDGRIDVAVGNEGQELIQILTGDSTGRFNEIVNVTDVSAPSDLVVSDLNGDGFAEVAVTNLFNNIAPTGSEPEYRLPSTVTILRLDVAAFELTVNSETVTETDVVFSGSSPEMRFDTTGEGEVTSLDALRVINAIASSRADGEVTTRRSEFRSSTDVNDDGTTSAIDALLIINHLGRIATTSSGQYAVNTVEVGTDDDDEDVLRIAAIDHLMAQTF